MAWRNVDETTQVYAMDEAVIFIAYNVIGLGEEAETNAKLKY